MVYELAQEYFALPRNHTAVIEDATLFVEQEQIRAVITEQETGKAGYDYVMHDVFTGGAEPAELFTLEFIQGLSKLLKPNGVIAIVSFFKLSIQF